MNDLVKFLFAPFVALFGHLLGMFKLFVTTLLSVLKNPEAHQLG